MAADVDILLDCDPGLDDAVAIVVAERNAGLLGVTTVGGNVGLDHTTRNARAVLDILGRDDIPVHSGADHPLAGADRLQRAEHFHGPSGTGAVVLPAPSRPADSADAVAYLADSIERHDHTRALWLVATGPLTNVAGLVMTHPSLVRRLSGIAWMGGSATYGNATAAAEFNAWADPEAAEVVFGSGHPGIVMVGLHLTHTVLLDRHWLECLVPRVSGTPMEVFAEMIDFYDERQRRLTTLAGAAVHDAVAVAAVSHPHLFGGLRRHVQVITEGAARGMTLVDRRPTRAPVETNATVLEWANAPALQDLLLASLAGDRSS